MAAKRKTRAEARRKRLKGRKRAIPTRSVRTSAALECPHIIDLGDPALREAFRVWWSPYDMGLDFDMLVGRTTRAAKRVPGKRGLRRMVVTQRPKHDVTPGDLIQRRKLDPTYFRHIDRALRRARLGRSRSRDMSTKKAPVRVIIQLTYPLTRVHLKIVTIDRRYPGAIFGLAHDFYRELYAEDVKRGGKAGPMNDGRGPILNRGAGPLVWGHDLGDLVFESCQYRQFDKETAQRMGAEGEFTFGIGS